MPTPKEGYFTADGKRAPGTTTVLGMWPKPALVAWAYKQGKEGLPLYESRDAAADIGTVAHERVADFVMGRPFSKPLPDHLTDYQKIGVHTAVSAFVEWWEDSRIEVIETEVQLVSERHRFGGTPDWIAVRGDGKRLFLPDVKTSNGTYADHVMQVAAYVELWEEVHPGRPMDGGAAIARFDKTSGMFSYKGYPREALRAPWEAFLHLRALYALKPGLEALAK